MEQAPALASRRVAVAGASGTIGRAVALESLARGNDTLCLLRDNASGRAAAEALQAAGAQIIRHDWAGHRVDTIISCIASRSGSPKDARRVDYDLNSRLLNQAIERGAQHFILLSAICVQNPMLAFQRAKLAFEAELQAAAIDHTIVRPTAFFKSLSGQVARVAAGKPFLLFGDGELTRCKPISDRDLARFIVDCVSDPARRGAVLPIGGPGPAISLREQGAMLFELAGREPKFRSISPRLFDWAARALSLGAPLSDWFAEKAEYARIAKYYATQSMLMLDPATQRYDADATPEYGSDTLRDHYAKLLEDYLPPETAPATR